ncbi:hypothetical protein QL285_049970 [Trifolium repens]|jgi:hypothetical protein|nr:hypothetical protein QL285_049970 [Trifolium repens]
MTKLTENPMGLISCIKVYFQLRDTKSEVWVNLARPCMKGPTIHFFKARYEEAKPTWKKLKVKLLDWSKMGEILTEMCIRNYLCCTMNTVWRNTSKNTSASLHRWPDY